MQPWIDAMVRAGLLSCAIAALLSCGAVGDEPVSETEPARTTDRTHDAQAWPLPEGEVTALVTEAGRLRPRLAEDAKARVWLPVRAGEGLVIEDPATSLAATVSMLDASAAEAELVDGRVVYRGAHRDGGDVVLRVTPEGVEDHVSFPRRPAEEAVRYLVGLGDEVAGLRLVANQLELLDDGGAPRLRVTPPYLVDAAGRRHEAALAVSGCDVDTDPRAPWGRPPTAPGADRCELDVRWDGAAVAYPAWLDPFWTVTGSLAQGRFVHDGSLLKDGRVLVAGGFDNVVTFSSTEIYDPSTETWAATGSLSVGRFRHAMTLLDNGRVLATGGYDDTQSFDSAEIYDPSTGTWTTTGSLGTLRRNHTSTLLPDGTVLVTGGENIEPIALCERFDPATGLWSATGDMNGARSEHEAALVAGGRVLVMGGQGPMAVASAEIYDESTETWSAVPDMMDARTQHTATVLADGRVLVVGGRDESEDLLTTEIFDPATLSWTPTAVTTFSWRQHTATRLTDGRVLVAGGWSQAELYDVDADTWTKTDNVGTPRRYHTAHQFPEGRVMMVAGRGDAGPLASAEIFSPLGNLSDVCTIADECESGHCVDGVCCDTACGDGVEGDCVACDLAGLEGTCSPEPEGNACGDTGVACHLDDTCDGAGVCVDAGLVPDGTSCEGGTCLDGICEPEDGEGGSSGGPIGGGGPGGTSGADDGGSSGCGCRTGADDDGAEWAWLGLGLLALGLRRRPSSRQLP